MNLPLEPPVEPMLAKLEKEIPAGKGWRYEPKWDGFRAIIFRDGAEVRIGSRGRKELQRYFPDVVAALKGALPRRCVVDGEIVLAGPDGLDFDLLQQRIHPAESRVRRLAGETPASYVAFDLLAQGSRDLQRQPLLERWAALERIVEPESERRALKRILGRGTEVVLTPHTPKVDVARRWFEELEDAGLDGIVAKRDDLTYQPGKRAMVKVKHERTLDVVVAGYRVHKSGAGVGSLLLGLYDEQGVLHHVGAAGAFPASERIRLREMLRPLEGGEGFGEGHVLGGPSRWRPQEREWIPLEPRLVCEVAYDHFQGEFRLRHLAQFLRWRPDREPRDCTFAQVRPGRG
jgi:ATP-dependent DNA ligase